MSNNVTVTAADDQLDHIEELAGRLRAAGMRIEGVHPAIGIITGAVTDEQRSAIAEIPGVANIEVAHDTFRLPPPDSEIQ